MFYPPQGASTHQPKTALQQKVLGQRSIQSHQVRDISPLNQNLRTKPVLGTNTAVQNRAAQSSSGGYVPFEPKKRELTQKIAPKMPASQANHERENIPNPGSGAHGKLASHTGGGGTTKLLDKRTSSSTQASSSNQQLFGSSTHNRPGSGKGSSSGNHHKPSGATRGLSPSFQSKTSDLSAKNRGTLNSSYKRSTQTAHPPVHPSFHGSDGPQHPPHSKLAFVPMNQRPGSAPKMRTQTPNADTSAGNANSSLVLRSQPST